MFCEKIPVLALSAMFALAAPGLAVAQHEDEHHDHGGPQHPGGPPHPPPAKPFVAPHGPQPGPGPKPFVQQHDHEHGPPHGPVGGPNPGGPPPAAFVHPGGPGGPRFSFHGRDIERVHRDPFIYPPGWAYRRWAVGGLLPPLFLAREYWYPDWAALDLPPPPPGTQWVRYGPDLLLVDVTTGQVIDVAYDVFY